MGGTQKRSHGEDHETSSNGGDTQSPPPKKRKTKPVLVTNAGKQFSNSQINVSFSGIMPLLLIQYTVKYVLC